jgi:hypothetical protein
MPDGSQLAAYAIADIEGRFAAVDEGEASQDVSLYTRDTFVTPGQIGDLFIAALTERLGAGFNPATSRLTWGNPLSLIWLARSAGTGRMAGWYGYATVSCTPT